MTDQDLIQLVQEKPPEQLSLDEIQRLRERLTQSAELRQTLLERLQMEEYLAAALGRENVSVDRIMLLAGQVDDPPSPSSMSPWGWALCLFIGVILAVAAVLVTFAPWQADDEQLVARRGAAANGKTKTRVAGSDAPEKTAAPAAADVKKSPGGGDTKDPAGKDQPLKKDPPAAVDLLPEVRITLEAEQFARGDAAVDRDEWGRGIGVIHSGPPGEQPARFVEYDVDVPRDGQFHLRLRYASDARRPVRLAVNGLPAAAAVADQRTGGWKPDQQRWYDEGEFRFVKGINVLRLQSDQPLPHLDKLSVTSLDATHAGDDGSRVLVRHRPGGPWDAALAAPPRALEEVAFEGFGGEYIRPGNDEIKQWLHVTSGGLSKQMVSPRPDVRPEEMIRLNGRARLLAPWDDGHVLRLEVYNPQRYQIHVFNGPRGMMLAYYPSPRPQWAVYATTRRGNDAQPDSYALVATDEDRAPRTNRHGGILELRCQGGRLALCRGDVAVVGAAFEGLPEQVYLNGDLTLGAITMIRSPGLPPAPPAHPTARATGRPATLTWTEQLADGARFNKLPDGGVELSAGKTDKLTWAAVPLPTDGLHEVVLEIENPQPGAGVFLGDEQGRPLHRIGYCSAEPKKWTAVEYLPPGDNRLTSQHRVDQIANTTVPVVGPRHWLRVLVGCGTLKCWISGDGVYWGRAFAPVENLQGRYAHAGLYCVPGGQQRGVKLRRLEVRQLDAVNALADQTLRRQAPALEKAADFGAWLVEVTRSEPPDVDPRAWRRACAVRTLAACPPKALGAQIIECLAAETMGTEQPLESQLALFDQLALVTDCWNDAPLTATLADRYFQAAGVRHRAGMKQPYSSVLRRWITAPIWSQHALPASPGGEAPLRAELLELAEAGQWHEAYRLCRQLRTWDQDLNSTATAWVEARAGQELGDEIAGDARLLPQDWRHPLLAEIGREAFNVVQEFEAALASDSYELACRIISSASTYGALGLLPKKDDPRLYISMSGAVRMAMQDHPRLRATMNDAFGPLGKLRIGQAMAEGDADKVQAATIQFYGTEAAGKAYRWLGDRALASGDFTEAIERYRKALETVPAAERGDVNARRRLAAAMMGHDLGEPATAPVHFGEVKRTAEEFEKMVAEMRTSHAGQSGTKTENARLSPVAQAPAPAALKVQQRSRLDGETSGDPRTAPRGVDAAVFDWRARQLGFTVADNVLYVSNRLQISAYDLNNNAQRRWQVSLGDDKARRLCDWSLAPMRPLVVGERIYARRIAERGPELVALDRAQGQRLWSTDWTRKRRRRDETALVVSDPLFFQRQLLAITLQTAGELHTLHLTALDPESGEVLRESPLADLRAAWHNRPVCEVAAAGDAIVATFGGGTLCCDLRGTVRWIRRHEWLPASQDPTAAYQNHDRPLVVDRRVYLTQPGVRSVSAVQLDTGRQLWSVVLPGVRRLIGRVDGRLLIETDDGFLALREEDGARLWHHDAPRRLDARLWGGEGGLLYARAQPAQANGNNQPRVALVWLDPATGAARAQTTIDAFTQPSHLKFGPLVSHNDRLWGFFGGQANDPHRTLFELAKQGAAEPIHDVADPWLAHVPAGLAQGAARVLPQWSLLAATGAPDAGYVAEYRGRRDVLALSSPEGRPVWLARRVSVPRSGRPRLKMIAGQSPGGAAWSVEVHVGRKTLLKQPINAQTAPSGWQDIQVDLKSFAGRTVWLMVRQQALPGAAPTGYWKRLDVVF